MPKHENNALQKKFYNQFKKGTFSVECAHVWGMAMHGKTNLMITKYSMKPM